MRIHIAGKWSGEYHYASSSEEMLPAVVGFTLVLRKGWFGRFRGKVRNDPATGMLEEGTVEGRLKAQKVEMVKQFPVCRVNHEGKNITAGELLRNRGIEIPEGVELPHRAIEYEGSFTDSDHAEGSWRISFGPLEFWGYVMQMREMTGTWCMWRD